MLTQNGKEYNLSELVIQNYMDLLSDVTRWEKMHIFYFREPQYFHLPANYH